MIGGITKEGTRNTKWIEFNNKIADGNDDGVTLFLYAHTLLFGSP